MMIFFENMMITYVLLNNFKFQKMQVVNDNWLQWKIDGKYKLNVKYSYLATIYQA
jgi:hypothetical protein